MGCSMRRLANAGLEAEEDILAAGVGDVSPVVSSSSSSASFLSPTFYSPVSDGSTVAPDTMGDLRSWQDFSCFIWTGPN